MALGLASSDVLYASLVSTPPNDARCLAGGVSWDGASHTQIHHLPVNAWYCSPKTKKLCAAFAAHASALSPAALAAGSSQILVIAFCWAHAITHF